MSETNEQTKHGQIQRVAAHWVEYVAFDDLHLRSGKLSFRGVVGVSPLKYINKKNGIK